MLGMTNYAIDDGNGDLICTGLSESTARAKAQREANERSAAVLLYVDGDGSEDPGEVIEPDGPAPAAGPEVAETYWALNAESGEMRHGFTSPGAAESWLVESAGLTRSEIESHDRSSSCGTEFRCELRQRDHGAHIGEIGSEDAARSAARAQIRALRLRAVNGVTRAIARDGLSLSHQEADSLGEEVLAWARQRLGVRVETDSDGVRLVPETPPAMDPDRRAAVEKVAEQWCLTLHGPASVPVVVEILIAEGPHGEARPWSAGRIRELGEIDIFAKRDGGSMFAQLRRLLGAQGFEILAYQSLGSSSHHEHQARVGRLAGR